MRLYNTLTRSVEEFVPREDGRVTMYVCGPTVQGPPHFGHGRAYAVPDVLRRYLEWSGYDVFHVRNITDIDDKIIARAQAEARPTAAVAEEFSRIWENEIARMGFLPPHIVPRATGHVLEMHGLIGRLLESGIAYEAGGDVLYSVRSFPEYGKLSGRNIDDLRAGARVEPGEHKRDPLDFVLWKAAKPDEPAWPSPWGPGRPGWHIECSAMAMKYLGETFDVHTGGTDLIFPHHENEIAQSEAATGQPFARYWLHNGLLNLSGEKMAKSVGNIISLSEALDRYGADTLRFYYLSAHYRSSVEFSEERLDEAAAAIDRWRAFLRAARHVDATADTGVREDALARFREAMEDNLATPAAHAVRFDLDAAGHRHRDAGGAGAAAAARDTLVELSGVLGYRLAEHAAASASLIGALVEELLAIREDARKREDFATADKVRARLAELGIVVEDSPQGARWHHAHE
jgi:cysteinyl-tRNA synthetase